jgi:hypothetical protein
MVHVWPYEVDWNVTAAGFSALIAAAVAAWTAWWSWDTRRREGLTKRAAARLAWIEKFRGDLAEWMGHLTVAGSHFITNTPLDYSNVEKAKQLALYHRLMMDLPAAEPHLTALRKSIYAVFQDHKDTEALSLAMNDLEFTALVAFETERQIALRELDGSARDITGVAK